MTKPMREFKSGLILHRDGKVRCSECNELIDYEALYHLDYYADIQFAQCRPCAAENGEYCAVTESRGAPGPLRNPEEIGLPA